MNIHLLTAVAATALMTLPSLAMAEDSGWYIRGNAGYGIVTDTDFTGDLVGDVEGEANVAGSVGLGYEFSNNWRLELDGAKIWNDMGAISQASNTTSDMRVTTGMINAIYDFGYSGAWEPYIGAGVGIAKTSLSAEASAFPNNLGGFVNNPACPNYHVCSFNDSDTGFAWQALAGMGVKLSDNLTWDTQYRYQDVADADIAGLGITVDPATGSFLSSQDIMTTSTGAGSHSVMTGFRYKFGATTPKRVVSYTCWDGSRVENLVTCPSKPPKPVYVSCWDGSQVESASACPVQMVNCWDGSTATSVETCPVRPTVTCWDGSMVFDQASCPVMDRITELCSKDYRQEVIYYRFNQPQSAETRAKVQNVLDSGQNCDVGNINVIGHTDSSGSAAYNQRLSERRAADVRNELIRQGINSALITSQGKGETALAVPTGDGVREPLNRRTEVIIQLNETGRIN